MSAAERRRQMRTACGMNESVVKVPAVRPSTVVHVAALTLCAGTAIRRDVPEATDHDVPSVRDLVADGGKDGRLKARVGHVVSIDEIVDAVAAFDGRVRTECGDR